MLDSGQVCERLGITRTTLWRWCREKQIPFYRMPGNILRFDEKEFEKWLEERKNDRNRT